MENEEIQNITESIFGFIEYVELLLFAMAGVLLIYFLIRKFKKEREENFEQRDN